jgi:hypothetical protein
MLDSVVIILDSVVIILDSAVIILDSVVIILDSVVIILDSIVIILDSVVIILDSVVIILDMFRYICILPFSMCMFCRCPFVLFLLCIVLSVLLRFTDSDYLPLVSSYSSN